MQYIDVLQNLVLLSIEFIILSDALYLKNNLISVPPLNIDWVGVSTITYSFTLCLTIYPTGYWCSTSYWYSIGCWIYEICPDIRPCLNNIEWFRFQTIARSFPFIISDLDALPVTGILPEISYKIKRCRVYVSTMLV